ncbi:DUF6418 domain-containing protein [Pseudomonas indica]|uniref:DUF6418 domain-containing protein n=1 Tax=Pseudomonas indica TaxID=137658 RepID=A0A1G8YTI9_9PSED|nr:DUF6418 domain-containing protein [Pseudomonas indica]SDK05395.1 hypothetical protein SAMN05216186_10486 [Pseudomonas indica]
MIIYFVLVFLLLVFLGGCLFHQNVSFLYVQSLFWFFGFVGFVSVAYLEAFDVYIIEQFKYSHFNGAAIFLFFLMFTHFVGGATWARFRRGDLSGGYSKYGLVPAWEPILIGCVSLLVLTLLYVNVLISSPPPLFQDGYIDRFEYIQGTSLWWVIAPMGVVAVPLPILLGWLFLVSKRHFFPFFLTLLYLLYLALIGQKFGGFILSFFLVSLPLVCEKAFFLRLSLFLKKALLPVLVVFIISLSMVYYHYTRYSLSDEFGGPLGLLAYRILGLQGHTFWGAYDLFVREPFLYFNPAGLWDGMENVMLLISPDIADGMIERGVRFTFGYFASLVVHLGVFAFPAALIFGVLHSAIAIRVVKAVLERDLIGYFLLANMLVMYNGFISMGSLSGLLNLKLLFLLLLLLGVTGLRWAMSGARGGVRGWS